MSTHKVTDASFEADVLNSTTPVVVDFWAPWCGPCIAIGPALEEIATSLGEKVKIVKINVDENHVAASKYAITSIPRLIIFKGGQAVADKRGAAPKSQLQSWIESSI
jgi:thioredoxin 1